MKSILVSLTVLFALACNNSQKEPDAANEKQTEPVSSTVPSLSDPAPGGPSVVYHADGVEIKHYASVLVTTDKGENKSELPYLCMLTSNAAANNNEYLGINFLLDKKPGTYPVTGYSFQRGKDTQAEMYGNVLGGNKATDFTVTITECKDLGENGTGGHKWSISGTWQDMTIKATPIMLLDKTQNHPAEVKISNGTFSNLQFDDNWDKMLEEGLKKMKE